MVHVGIFIKWLSDLCCSCPMTLRGKSWKRSSVTVVCFCFHKSLSFYIFAKMVNSSFVYHFDVRGSLQLILIFCRPSTVCRDQDGEWKVKGLWDSQIWRSRECWEGLQDDEWNQDQWPGGGRPHRSQRLKLWGGLANTLPHSALLPMIFCFVLF